MSRETAPRTGMPKMTWKNGKPFISTLPRGQIRTMEAQFSSEMSREDKDRHLACSSGGSLDESRNSLELTLAGNTSRPGSADFLHRTESISDVELERQGIQRRIPRSIEALIARQSADLTNGRRPSSSSTSSYSRSSQSANARPASKHEYRTRQQADIEMIGMEKKEVFERYRRKSFSESYRSKIPVPTVLHPSYRVPLRRLLDDSGPHFPVPEVISRNGRVLDRQTITPTVFDLTL
jgi:hypothetical protein